MIRVCFTSIFSVVDSVSANNLRKKLIHLAEQDTHLEFWFTICYDAFDKIAVEQIMELRTLFPMNQIDIVAVIDPLRYERLSFEDFQEQRDGFPRGAVTKLEYAPRIEGKCELLPNRFVEHSRKIDRWIVEQCNIIFAYHYADIPDYTNLEIKRIKKKGTTEVISIYNPGVAKKISEYMDSLEGREGIVMQGLRKGRTYKELGAELGISTNRVQQISHKATRSMFQEIREYIH